MLAFILVVVFYISTIEAGPKCHGIDKKDEKTCNAISEKGKCALPPSKEKDKGGSGDKCYWNSDDDPVFDSPLFGKPEFLGFAKSKEVVEEGDSSTKEKILGKWEKKAPAALTDDKYLEEMALFTVGPDREMYKLTFNAKEFAKDQQTSGRRRLVPGALLAGGPPADIGIYPFQATGALKWRDANSPGADYDGVAEVIRSTGAYIYVLTAGHNCYEHDIQDKTQRVGYGYKFYLAYNNAGRQLASIPAAARTHRSNHPRIYYTEYANSHGAQDIAQHKVDFCVIRLRGANAVQPNLRIAYDNALDVPNSPMDVATYYQPDRARVRADANTNWAMRKFTNLALIARGSDIIYKRGEDMASGMSGSPLVLAGNRRNQYGVFVGCTGDNDYFTRITKNKYRIILTFAGMAGTGRGTQHTSGVSTARMVPYNELSFDGYQSHGKSLHHRKSASESALDLNVPNHDVNVHHYYHHDHGYDKYDNEHDTYSDGYSEYNYDYEQTKLLLAIPLILLTICVVCIGCLCCAGFGGIAGWFIQRTSNGSIKNRKNDYIQSLNDNEVSEV